MSEEPALASDVGVGTARSHEDPIDASRLRGRVQLTGVSAVYVLLGVPSLVVLTLLTTGLGLSALGVGLVLVLFTVPLTELLAQTHRRLASRVLGVRIESAYRSTVGGSPFQRLQSWVKDPARWRDYLWIWASVTLGWSLAWIVFGLPLAMIWYAIFPFVYAVTPDGIFDINYGLYRIDSFGTSFREWVFVPIAVGLWWSLTPTLIRWRAQIDRALLSPSRNVLEHRVAQVAKSRAESIDHSAAELRRIERDLHDGTQARLVSLGMSLGMAEQLFATDPQAAARLLTEARTATTSALVDLRAVVRGIHPPVLADRGLVGAVNALALDMALPVSVTAALIGRPPAPVESAVYFAVAECLANIAKHSQAAHASIELNHDGQRLRAVVSDDGQGVANSSEGSGLAGIAHRLSAFDGTLLVDSPTGGPTIVTMELPCALSSPRTTRSSGTA